jgi:hypothetical protein
VRATVIDVGRVDAYHFATHRVEDRGLVRGQLEAAAVTLATRCRREEIVGPESRAAAALDRSRCATCPPPIDVVFTPNTWVKQTPYEIVPINIVRRTRRALLQRRRLGACSTDQAARSALERALGEVGSRDGW